MNLSEWIVTTQPTPAPTPRTDAMLNGCEWGNRQDQEHTILCRTLERELTSAQATLAAKDREIAELTDQLRIVVDAESFRARKIERDRDTLRAEVERKNTALKWAAGEAKGRLPEWFHEAITDTTTGWLNPSEATQLRAALAAAQATAREAMEGMAHETARCEALTESVLQLRADKERLDWLDSHTAALNDMFGTEYGWRFDINHNRTQLTLSDCHIPVLVVRAAIDAARKAQP